MSERMQTLHNMQEMKLSSYRRNMTKSHKIMRITHDFEREVMQDQAASVFLTANARLLLKAQTLN